MHVRNDTTPSVVFTIEFPAKIMDFFKHFNPFPSYHIYVIHCYFFCRGGRVRTVCRSQPYIGEGYGTMDISGRVWRM